MQGFGLKELLKKFLMDLALCVYLPRLIKLLDYFGYKEQKKPPYSGGMGVMNWLEQHLRWAFSVLQTTFNFFFLNIYSFVYSCINKQFLDTISQGILMI